MHHIEAIITGGASALVVCYVMRNKKQIWEGKIGTLKRFKDDVKEVNAGYECGIGLEGFNDIEDGDILEIFALEEVKI